MGSVMIGDFGNREGVQTYRICGTKEDLYEIINTCRKLDAKFDDTPIINHVHNGQWTMRLKIKIPVNSKVTIKEL